MVLIVVADALRGGELESSYVFVATPIVYYVNTVFLPIHVPSTYAKWWRLAGNRPHLSASKNTGTPANRPQHNRGVPLTSPHLEEHESIKQLIKQADKAHPGSDDYTNFIKRAVDEFLNHADEEERDQLTEVTSKLSAEENDVNLDRSMCYSRR